MKGEREGGREEERKRREEERKRGREGGIYMYCTQLKKQ